MADDKYLQRGVSAAKEDVHAAIGKMDKGLFPNTFCKIYPDVLANDPDYFSLMSSDGSGSKSTIAYLYWKETGDVSIWEGIAQDVIVMNLDDLLCVGATGPFLFSSVINRNKHKIPGEVLKALIEGGQKFLDSLVPFGIHAHYLGGETADLGDLVRTATIDGTMTTRMHSNSLIDAGNIQPGQLVVGLSSAGKASYESQENSGIGSNGLTSARHDVLANNYIEKYPESFDPNTDTSLIYAGSKLLTDQLEGSSMDIGHALLSPTRTYAPVIKNLISELGSDALRAVIHCTGGAQTKVLHFLQTGCVVKDQLPEAPPIFQLIQRESKSSLNEMYKVFNMGIRLNIYVDNQEIAEQVIAISQSFDIDAKVIGHVEESDSPSVKVIKDGETLTYHP